VKVEDQLIHLIQHKNGLRVSTALKPAKSALAWHRYKFGGGRGFPPHRAFLQRDAHEFATQARAIERPTSFPYPRRANKTQDNSFTHPADEIRWRS